MKTISSLPGIGCTVISSSKISILLSAALYIGYATPKDAFLLLLGSPVLMKLTQRVNIPLDTVRMKAQLRHYGKHYYIDTTEELSGRGIEFLKTYAVKDLTAAGQRCFIIAPPMQYSVDKRVFKSPFR